MTTLTHRNPVVIEKTNVSALVVKDDSGVVKFSIDSTTGNLTLAGTVDGVDVASLGTSGLDALSSGEVDQIANIDSVTISNTQWGYLGGSDQSLATTDSPTFNNITVTGTVDGIDIATQDAKLVALHDTIGLSALTSAEVDQLENIGATTISATQWGYLGGSDQSLATTDSPTFNNITVTGTVDGIDIATQDAKLVALHDTIGLSALTSAEVDQLENIGATTISATQWGYLGGSDQALATTDSPTFNNITVTGTVDGIDIATQDAKLVALHDTIGLSALTSAEVDQLENIGATTISATQWGYLGGSDQSLATTDSPTFNSITVTGTVDGIDIATQDAKLVALHDTIGLSALTFAEVDQLENIGATTISATQWGYLGGSDQSLTTTDSPTFNNITVTGTVDGIDIATQDAKLVALHDTIGLSALTSAEVDQLENIGATTISATQWGYLGATDQALATTDAVAFNSAIIDSTGTEAFLVRKDADGGDVFKVDTTNSAMGLNANALGSGRFHIGYNTGSAQFCLERSDGNTGFCLIIDSNSDVVIQNPSGGKNISLLVNESSSSTIKTTDGTLDFSLITSLLYTINVNTVIDRTSSEAFLVRKDADGGDVFAVDTTNSIISIDGATTIDSSLSATPSAGGGWLSVINGGATFTDTDTAASGTSAVHSAVGIGAMTLAASNTSVTTTDAASFYIAGAPIAGTNQTITNAYALWVDSGNVKFDGDLTVEGSVNFASSGFESVVIDGTSTEALLIRKDGDAGDVFAVDTTNSIVTADAQVIIDTTSTEAFLVRKDGDSKDIFTVNTDAEFIAMRSRAFISLDSSVAFVVEESGGTDLFTVDTINDEVDIGSTAVLNVLNTAAATSGATGALRVSGGIATNADSYFDANLEVSGNVTVVGDLTVQGTTTTIDTQTLVITDNFGEFNAGPTGSADSGVLFKRYQTISDAGTDGDVTGDAAEETGTAQAGGSATTIVLAAGANANNDYYNGWWIKITSGDASNNVRKIKSYVGSTRTATIFSAADETASAQTPPTGADFTASPSATSVYELYDCSYGSMFFDESAMEFVFACVATDPNATVSPIRYTGLHVKSITSEDSISLASGLTSDGDVIFDNTSTEAFLVRKDGDSGDVFVVDTTNDTVEVTGDITVTGTVDGIDIATQDAKLVTLHDTIGLNALTSAEVDQLENIGTSTISAAQWGYLGSTDQSVATTDNVQFNNVIVDTTSTDALLVRKNADGGDVFSVDTTNSIVNVTGDITVTGTVDGIDIATQDAKLVTLHDTIGLNALTSAEVDQLEYWNFYYQCNSVGIPWFNRSSSCNNR